VYAVAHNLLHCWNTDRTPRIKFLVYYLHKINYFYCAKNLTRSSGKTNLLISLIRHGSHRKRLVQQLFYCCVCIRHLGNVSTEPLPTNDKGTFTEPLHRNNKGTFTEPLPSNYRGNTQSHTHTHTHTHTATSSHKPNFISSK
jgi:hypothetical protein